MRDFHSKLCPICGNDTNNQLCSCTAEMIAQSWHSDACDCESCTDPPNLFSDIPITRPFTVVVRLADDEEIKSEDGSPVWMAHVIGHNLDNMTHGRTPEEAVYMAHDMLCCLSGAEIHGHTELRSITDALYKIDDYVDLPPLLERLERLLHPTRFED